MINSEHLFFGRKLPPAHIRLSQNKKQHVQDVFPLLIRTMLILWGVTHFMGSVFGFVPQTELAMRGSNGVAKGPREVCAAPSFILIRKTAYLVTLALVSPTRNRRSRAQTPIFTIGSPDGSSGQLATRRAS